jgi:hypothetical protein
MSALPEPHEGLNLVLLLLALAPTGDLMYQMQVPAPPRLRAGVAVKFNLIFIFRLYS